MVYFIIGEPLKDWVDDADTFIDQCRKKGYEVLELMPVYHHGWELDEWAALGKKDNKKYLLTTNHGSLVAEQQED